MVLVSLLSNLVRGACCTGQFDGGWFPSCILIFIYTCGISIQKKKKKINAYMPAIVSLRNLPELMCNE